MSQLQTLCCEQRYIGNLILLCLDVNDSGIGKLICSLRHMVTFIQSYDDVDECVNFLIHVKDEKVILFISSVTAETLLPTIHAIEQLHSIYICDKLNERQWDRRYYKVRSVRMNNVMDMLPLYDRFKQDMRYCEQTLIPISILSSISENSNPDLNQLDPLFMYSKLLKEILLENINFGDKKQL